MDPIRDKFLEDKGGLDTRDSKGSFATIPMRRLEVVAAYLQLAIDADRGPKKLRVLDILINAKQFFEDRELREKDQFWKEHLASTLQEPLDGGFDDRMSSVMKFLPKRDEDPDAMTFYTHIQTTKTFLNDMKHMTYPDAVNGAKILLRDASITAVSDECFERACALMIDVLYGWFSTHCLKGS